MSKGNLSSIIGRDYYINQALLETDEWHPLNSAELGDRIIQLDSNGWVSCVKAKVIRTMIHIICDYNERLRACSDVKKGWYLEPLFSLWEVKLFINQIERCKFLSVANKRVIINKVLKYSTKTAKELFKTRYGMIGSISSDDENTIEYIDVITRAIYLKKKIRFKYLTHYEPKKWSYKKSGDYYILNPYQFYYDSDTYFVIGGHDHHTGPTTYRFDRMRDVEMLDDDRSPAALFFSSDYDMEVADTRAHSVENYSGDRVEVVVKIRRGDNVALDIIHDFVADDYYSYPAKGEPEFIYVRFEKNNSPTLVNWATSFVQFVEIVEPECVREECEKRAEMLKIYCK